MVNKGDLDTSLGLPAMRRTRSSKLCPAGLYLGGAASSGLYALMCALSGWLRLEEAMEVVDSGAGGQAPTQALSIFQMPCCETCKDSQQARQ